MKLNKRKLENYFKTDMIFHTSFLDNLETAISTNTNLTEKQKNDLIMPLYRFYEYPKNFHNKQDKIIMPIFKTEYDKYGI